MNGKQVQKYVLRYLEATDCHIIEKQPSFVTVKLSPQADRALTNRSYYWSFVERTGVPPETMTFKFIFDRAEMTASSEAATKPPGPRAASPASPTSPGGPTSAAAGSQTADGAQDSILGRYFGVTPTAPAYAGRIPQDDVTYGSSRLEQIFQAAKAGGSFVMLFEEPKSLQRGDKQSYPYGTWLGINYKVEFQCDMKRDEMHSLAISLVTGDIVEQFHDRILMKKMTPRLPVNVYVTRTLLTLPRAMAKLEAHLEKKLAAYDRTWAQEAQERLNDELHRIDAYYTELIQSSEEGKKAEVEEQFNNRKAEIEWQYKPRIAVSAAGCGIFHLCPDPFAGN